MVTCIPFACPYLVEVTKVRYLSRLIQFTYFPEGATYWTELRTRGIEDPGPFKGIYHFCIQVSLHYVSKMQLDVEMSTLDP